MRNTAREEGIDLKLADEVIAENQQAIIEDFGTQYANEIMGEPSPLERYH